MNFKNIIICPPIFYEKILAKNFNKTIECSVWCENDRWYYYTKAGRLRTVFPDKGIYTAVYTDGWPELYLKRIRKFNENNS